ncbi:Rof/RNase P-like protein [Russula vinacea]|nr:Rof/RNase P-like protein [Russula vinacea]
MGRREAAEMGIWRLREEEARWVAFVPLHRLWLGYMSELLGLAESDDAQNAPATPTMSMPMAAGMHAKLVKADFHGSIMTVRRSKNASLVGASGIVVQETENTFKVVTRKDKLKVLPKQGSVFAFAVPLYSTNHHALILLLLLPRRGDGVDDVDAREAAAARTVLDGPHIEFELYGNQFCFRAADRAGRKFKHKETIEL